MGQLPENNGIYFAAMDLQQFYYYIIEILL